MSSQSSESSETTAFSGQTPPFAAVGESDLPLDVYGHAPAQRSKVLEKQLPKQSLPEKSRYVPKGRVICIFVDVMS